VDAVGLTDGFALVEVNPEGELVQAYVIPVTEDEPIEVEPPVQMDLSAPAFAVGNGLTVITTVSLLIHPVDVFVTVRKYEVVAFGLTEGLAVVFVNPLGEEVHEYVFPITEVAPIEVEVPLQIVLSPPALAVGNGFTVITTVSLFIHPVEVLVTVTKYVVDAEGFTAGLALVEVNPLGEEVHEYVFPVTAVAPMVVEAPLHIVLSEPAFAVGNGLTVITTVSLFIHPVEVLVDVKK
jgi:hypothetical protein